MEGHFFASSYAGTRNPEKGFPCWAGPDILSAVTLYALAHRLLPEALSDPLLASMFLAAGKAKYAGPVDSFFAQAGFPFKTTCAHAVVEGFDVVAFTLPPPTETTHGYFFMLVVPAGEVAPLSYFVLERSVNVMTRESSTVIGRTRIGRGFRHENFGDGPLPTGDLATDAWAMSQRVIPIVKSERVA